MSSILLVEDSATQAMQMKLLLESASHQVICSDDGTTAIEHLQPGTSEIVVTLPANMVALSNGVQLSDRAIGGDDGVA